MAEAAAEIGRVFKGKYRIERKLGAGAFGTVYAAVQLGLDKPVAVKLLAPEAFKTPGASERFEREALLASKISHPVMAQVLDFGVDDGTPFLVMELVEGDDLSTVLAEGGALKPARAIAIMRQLASLLGEVHACGIVHRDLKPANMKLLRYSKTARQIHVKVLDFGIAKDIGSEAVQRLTATGSFVGTPRYMSPEQVRGGAVDARSDLYSCGVIFYELLTGDAPFRAGSVIELIARVLNDPPPELPARFPEALRQTVARLLDKDPAVRFEDAHALDAALEECELACRGMDFAETQRSADSDALAATVHSAASGSGPAPRPPTGSGSVRRPPTAQGQSSSAPRTTAQGQSSSAPPAAGDTAAAGAPAPRRIQLMLVVTLLACAAAVAAVFIALRRPGNAPASPPPPPGPVAPRPVVAADAGLALVHADAAVVAVVAAADAGGKAIAAHPPGRHPVVADVPPPARSEDSMAACLDTIERAHRFLAAAAFGRARRAALTFLASAGSAACPKQRLEARAVECKALCQNSKNVAYVACLHSLQQEGRVAGHHDATEITRDVQEVCGAYFKP